MRCGAATKDLSAAKRAYSQRLDKGKGGPDRSEPPFQKTYAACLIVVIAVAVAVMLLMPALVLALIVAVGSVVAVAFMAVAIIAIASVAVRHRIAHVLLEAADAHADVVRLISVEPVARVVLQPALEI